jgi:hypothetical protein
MARHPLLPVVLGVVHPGRRPLLSVALDIIRSSALDVVATLSILAALDVVRPTRCTLPSAILDVVHPAALNIVAALSILTGKDEQPGRRCSYGTRLEMTFFGLLYSRAETPIWPLCYPI